MKLEDSKILISDDSILARKQLKDVITALGTPTFFETSNGQDAIDCYMREKPDLVFLDIVMPVKDGNAASVKFANMTQKQKLLSFLLLEPRHS